uniref:Uncharacterized protein n=1 Tax=Aegilops tauschii subsp. strangulata TaxID=200361 RepID=A0A453JCX8_AEGTS
MIQEIRWGTLLSCFVWQEKFEDALKSREDLDLYQLHEARRRVAEGALKSRKNAVVCLLQNWILMLKRVLLALPMTDSDQTVE